MKRQREKEMRMAVFLVLTGASLYLVQGASNLLQLVPGMQCLRSSSRNSVMPGCLSFSLLVLCTPGLHVLTNDLKGSQH